MRVEANGTTLWFDVVGAGLEPDGARMRDRPTVMLLHGGPGGYDHSYLRPWFDWLSELAQVVYLDLRHHGRSAVGDPATWSLEACADDVAALCDALSIEAPIVIGHSLGGMVGLLYGERHPGRAAGLAVLGAMARYDVARITEGFRRVAGDTVAELARRSYANEDITDEEWEPVRLAFGPRVLSDAERARIHPNADLGAAAGPALLAFDVVAALPRITAPTLVVVGELDPVTPVEAAEEIAAGLAPGIGRLEILPAAGHWLWLDAPGLLRDVLTGFVAGVADRAVAPR